MVNEKLVRNEQVQKPVNKTRSIVKTIFVPVILFIMALGFFVMVKVIRSGWPSFREYVDISVLKQGDFIAINREIATGNLSIFKEVP